MPFTSNQLSIYIIAAITSGWIIPLVTHLVLRKRGENSRELFVVAEVWGGAIALGLLCAALAFAGLGVSMLFSALLLPLFSCGWIALIVVGFMRIREPAVGLPLILCGLLLLSAVAAWAYQFV
jgi:hypothetical protein